MIVENTWHSENGIKKTDKDGYLSGSPAWDYLLKLQLKSCIDNAEKK